MKLEAVDRRTPSFIRVASVEDVEDHRIKVGAGASVLSLVSRHCAGLLLPFPAHWECSVEAQCAEVGRPQCLAPGVESLVLHFSFTLLLALNSERSRTPQRGVLGFEG